MENKRRPSGRRFLLLMTGLFSALTLTGCVYLRLLEVKRNLRDFDNNFSVSGDKDWIINIKNPVMLSKDMIFMIGAAPLSIEKNGDVERWHYEFERVRTPDDKKSHPMDRLSLDLEMTNGKMSRFLVPTSYTQLFSHKVLTELLRSVPDAEVLELRRTIRAKIRLSPAADAELSSRDKTLSLLGKPFETDLDGNLETLIYKYSIVNDKDGVEIIARLDFSSDGLLRRTIIHWGGSTADAEFLRNTPG